MVDSMMTGGDKEKEEEVRREAYELWDAAGRPFGPDGRELEYWLQAEAMWQARHAPAAATPAEPASAPQPPAPAAPRKATKTRGPAKPKKSSPRKPA